MKARIWLLPLCLLIGLTAHGQELVRVSRYLYKPLDIEVKNARLEDVLNGLAKKGHFYFSYSTALVPADSLVSVSMRNRPIAEILDHLLGKKFEYRETASYIILRPAFYKFSIIPENIRSDRRTYEITGYVTNENTGAAVQDVSVYEKRLLRSTLTDKNGYFRLKFRGAHDLVMLSASRENYRDTTVVFLSSIKIDPRGYSDSTVSASAPVGGSLLEQVGLGRFFISSRQKIQSLNIPDFLANTPFQASLLPGLSSHGMFSSQVVNKASLNVLGGYTAGVEGVEVAGLFNINKGNMQYVQVGGLSNVVGGTVRGVQVAGLVNTILKSVEGVQIGGIANTVKDSVLGAQVGGIFNAVRKVSGLQIAGIANYAHGGVAGVQIAGIANLNRQTTGIQIAGIINRSGGQVRGGQVALLNSAKTLNGFQIGLINMAGSSTGYSLGLFNWVKSGYHKISVSTNDVTHANLTLKTGNPKLYTLITAGTDATDTAKLYVAGLGLGHDFIFSNRFSLSAEASTRYLYRGELKDVNLLTRLESSLQFQLFKPVTVFAGPAYNLFNTSSKLVMTGSGANSRVVSTDQTSAGKRKWAGWNVGITIF